MAPINGRIARNRLASATIPSDRPMAGEVANACAEDAVNGLGGEGLQPPRSPLTR